jgi:uncharacterized protein (DUF4415 family)
MAQSKNARTSKPKEFVKPVKEKKVKEYILIELTREIFETYREDLSVYDNKPVEDIIVRFGKTYLKIKNA